MYARALRSTVQGRTQEIGLLWERCEHCAQSGFWARKDGNGSCKLGCTGRDTWGR